MTNSGSGREILLKGAVVNISGVSLTRRLIGIAGDGEAEASGDYLVALEGAGERGMSHRALLPAAVVEQFQVVILPLNVGDDEAGG
jgi:hypothetical protein